MKITNSLIAVLICIIFIIGIMLISCEQISNDYNGTSCNTEGSGSPISSVSPSDNTTLNEPFAIVTNHYNPFHIELEPEKKDLPLSSDFQKIKAGMSEEEVCQLIGLPQRTETRRSYIAPSVSSTCDITFYLYDSAEGDLLRIFFVHSDSTSSSVIVQSAQIIAPTLE